MSETTHKNEYDEKVVARLQLLWGEGFMSPGGPAEVTELLRDIDLDGCQVLDIGCGIGGVELLLADQFNAKHVVGIDIELPLIERAQQRITDAGLQDRVSFRHVSPGPLPFDDQSYDVVFSKDAMIHIPDKQSLFGEVRRVLCSGGMLTASDWLQSEEGRGTTEMAQMSEAIGLTFSLATPEETVAALQSVGFENVSIRDRNQMYQIEARHELERLEGPLRQEAISLIGQEKYEKWALARRLICEALDKNFLRLVHVFGQCP
jgi:ubiquinone/menaquinone biosynthesis C-methylase UbiE